MNKTLPFKHTLARVQRAVQINLILALVLLGASLQPAQAQTAEDALLFTQRLPATGARSIGLSGTGIAGLGDYSDFFTNPAGLGHVKKSHLSATLNFLAATNEGIVSAAGFGNPIEEELTDQSLSNLAGIYKVPTNQGSLVIGASFNQTSSFSRNLFFQGLTNSESITDVLLPFDDEFQVSESDGVFFPEFFADLPEIAYLGGAVEFLGENVGTSEPIFYQAVNPGSTIEQSSDVFQEGRLKELSFGGAVEAAKGVMIGASLNFSFGEYSFESFFDEFDINGENTADLYVVLDGDTEYAGFEQVTYIERFESDLIGTNLRVGVSADAAPGARIGLTIETPTFYRVDETFETEVATFFDNGLSLAYGGQQGDIGRGTFEYDITTPWRFGAGLSYSISGLTLLGDLELVDWSQMELDASTDRAFFSDINRSIRDDFKAVVNTSLGAEYTFGNFTARIGYALQPDPNDGLLTLGDGSLLDPDTNRSYVSAGFGVNFSNAFAIDFGWMQETQEDIYIPDFTTYTVTEDIVRNHFQIGLSVLL